MFLTGTAIVGIVKKASVAIPSNRVNVSYEIIEDMGIKKPRNKVAIPSNRVNVSYLSLVQYGITQVDIGKSQSPQIGSMFPTIKKRGLRC